MSIGMPYEICNKSALANSSALLLARNSQPNQLTKNACVMAWAWATRGRDGFYRLVDRERARLTMPVPALPKIYHIVHVDRLASIVVDGCLWSDALVTQWRAIGTDIGMSNIKARRLNQLDLSCHPDLRVGHWASFYFCPISVMLYLIFNRNQELTDKGQELIVHLEADLHETIRWAEEYNRR